MTCANAAESENMKHHALDRPTSPSASSEGLLMIDLHCRYRAWQVHIELAA